jgi:hypothetical protein
MSVSELATFMMKHTVRIVLTLMIAGLAFMILNQLYPTLPEGKLFFTIAVGILLITPLLVALFCGVFFIYKKQTRMAVVTFALAAALALSGVAYMIVG